ncbi:Inorganic H+ pyrophosphatase, partial [mine drainage metagenome]
ALYKGLVAAAVVAIAGFAILTLILNSTGALSSAVLGHPVINLFWAGVIGIVITILIVAITEYFTGAQFSPVRSIARASQTGHATNIIAGLAVGLEAAAPPVFVIAVGIRGGLRPGRSLRNRHRRHGPAQHGGDRGRDRRLRSDHRQRRRDRGDG